MSDWLPEVLTVDAVAAALADPRMTPEINDVLNQRLLAERERLQAECVAQGERIGKLKVAIAMRKMELAMGKGECHVH